MKHPSSTLAMALMCLALAVLTFAASAGAAAPAVAGEYISEKLAAGYFQLISDQAAADIFVADDDWKVARIAAGDLALDIERVTWRKPAIQRSASKPQPKERGVYRASTGFQSDPRWSCAFGLGSMKRRKRRAPSPPPKSSRSETIPGDTDRLEICATPSDLRQPLKYPGQ